MTERTRAWGARLRAWQGAVQGPSLGLLLGVEAAFIFLIVPLVGTGTLGHAWVSAFQSLLALMSVFVIAGIGMTRAVIVVGFGLTLATSPQSPSPDEALLHSLGLSLFLVAVTWGIGRAVFGAAQVDHHQVMGAVVIYLNLALVFAVVFDALMLVRPAAFAHLPTGAGHQFGPLLYFSLSTLTTTGYGDIVPVHPVARSLSNLEAAAGQIYLTTLLARLVTLHVASRRA